MDDLMKLLIAISFLTIGFFVGFMVGSVDQYKQDSDNAIKAGVAEYVLTNPATGATEFRYKEIK